MLTDVHVDALAEFMNLGAGRAAAALSELVDLQARLNTSKVDSWRPAGAQTSLVRAFGHDLRYVTIGFRGLMRGQAGLLCSPELARSLTAHALESDEVDEAVVASTMEEIGNVTLNALLGSFSNLVGTEFLYDVPEYGTSTGGCALFEPGDIQIYARTRLQLAGLDEGIDRRDVVLVVRTEVPKLLLEVLEGYFQDDTDEQFLLPGDLVAARTPAVWSTVLGSCVAVCIRHRSKPWAAMNHFLLASGGSEGEMGRYGDSSIRAMWRKLSRWDPNPRNYHARVFGGAKLFQFDFCDIGGNNIRKAKEVLRELGIEVIEEQVGGSVGCHVRFETAVDRVQYRRHEAA